jgi:large subunit ribosomal protein L4
MKIDLFSMTGAKKGTLELPEVLFGGPINLDLMNQAVVRQRSNRRVAIAHVKNRGEVVGSTKKPYPQKHTGRARRGGVRSPLLRGGGKAFGPRNERNFEKDMPKNMRRAALRSCLCFQAKRGAIIGLEGYADTIKTKDFHDLLKKLPVDIGRRIVFVMPEMHKGLWMSSRNVPGVKTLLVSYLNPVDLMGARSVVFVGNSIEKAVELFGKSASANRVLEVKETPKVEKKEKKPKNEKKEKKTVKKATSKKSA